MKLFFLLLILPFGMCQDWDLDWPEENNRPEEQGWPHKLPEVNNPEHDSSGCEKNEHRGIWSCTKNKENGKLNLTYDCIVNDKKKADFWFWSPKFPGTIDVLTIQNCEELILRTHHGSDGFRHLTYSDGIYFQHLNILNISELLILDEAAYSIAYLGYYDAEDSYRDFEHGNPYHNSLSCSLKAILFKNIKKVHILPPIIPYHVHCRDLKSVTFINVKTDFLNEQPLFAELALNKFTMRNVTIDYVKSSFTSFFTANIEIIDSKFNNLVNTLVRGSASKVVVSNNYFGKSIGLRIFEMEADCIIFTENTIETLATDALSFKGRNISITNNVFHHVEENAFRNISASAFDPKLKISNSYIFSENIIYLLEPNALAISPQTGNLKMIFNNITIINNSIDCNCANMYWFDSLLQKKKVIEHYYFYQKWIKETNSNKCLNIPNCLVKQVLNDYRELCAGDLDCSKRTGNNPNHDDDFYMKQKHVLSSLMNYNNMMNQNNSNLMQNLIEKIEDKNMKKINKNVKNATMKNDLTLLNNERKNRGKHLWNLSEIDVIHSCLFIITLLFCITLLYIILEKFFKVSFFRVLILKICQRTKSILIEGEANSSSISELVSNI